MVGEPNCIVAIADIFDLTTKIEKPTYAFFFVEHIIVYAHGRRLCSNRFRLEVQPLVTHNAA